MYKVLLTLALVALVVAGPVKRVPNVFRGGRIVGGVEAKIEDFPYQVSFKYDNYQMCGGSIIDERTILTSARCTKGMDASRMSIMVGSNNLEKGDIYQVSSFTEHPEYVKYNIDYDVAILKLSSSIVFSNKVAPITLQEEDVEVAVGSEGHISGWGGLDDLDEEPQIILRTTEVDIISRTQCEADYRYPITDRMLCAKRAGKDACMYDAGGPLVVEGKQVGIVSWGFGCGYIYPRIYSKVSNLRSWIEANR